MVSMQGNEQRELRLRVIGRGRAARAALEVLTTSVVGAMSNLNLSDQGRREQARQLLASPNGRPAVEAEIDAAETDVSAGEVIARRRLAESTDVADVDLASHAATLAPVLNSPLSEF